MKPNYQVTDVSAESTVKFWNIREQSSCNVYGQFVHFTKQGIGFQLDLDQAVKLLKSGFKT